MEAGMRAVVVAVVVGVVFPGVALAQLAPASQAEFEQRFTAGRCCRTRRLNEGNGIDPSPSSAGPSVPRPGSARRRGSPGSTSSSRRPGSQGSSRRRNAHGCSPRTASARSERHGRTRCPPPARARSRTGPTPLPPESDGERAPSGRRALVGLESAPMDALGRAGRVERLTIQPRKKTHKCYSKGNRRPAK